MMKGRKLLQQVLNEYLVFSDKDIRQFVSSIEISDWSRDTLAYYLATVNALNEQHAWESLNRYWMQSSLDELYIELRGIYGE